MSPIGSTIGGQEPEIATANFAEFDLHDVGVDSSYGRTGNANRD